MKKLIKFKTLPWWWFAFALLILLCLAIILKLPNVQDMAIVALVAVTMIYVIITQGMLNEMKQQRLDAPRPLLVPVGGREGVARLAEMPRLDNESG
ncbi:MAG: hypothetical protein E3J34_03290 [Dehalococcoidia bacterium]|nr:MAG: hypothetical protein E3J34_03290 [Dehalococcoidia bacterium]